MTDDLIVPIQFHALSLYRRKIPQKYDFPMESNSLTTEHLSNLKQNLQKLNITTYCFFKTILKYLRRSFLYIGMK